MMSNIEESRKKFNKELRTGLLGMLLLFIINKSEEPLYGYKIIREIEIFSKGEFKLPEGTVYPILKSLETRGFLKSSWGKGKDGPRRRYYSITSDGRILLSEIIGDWKSVNKTMGNIIHDSEVV